MSKEIEKITNQAEQPAEIMEDVKPYTFRKLGTTDMFLMFKVLNKLGFKEFKDNEGLKKTLFVFMGGTTSGKVDVNKIGMDIFFEVAAIITEALPKAEEEIYNLLSSLSGLKVAEIKNQSPAVTLEMIVDLIKKEEFKDFFSVVLKLFK